MSKKKSKGEERQGRRPQRRVRSDLTRSSDVKPRKKGKADEGAAPVDASQGVAAHPEEATKPKPKMELKDYERELARLEIELVKLQEWIKFKGLKVVVVFEGRDAAGKGGTIKTITEMPQPAHLPCGGVGHPHRAGEDAVVFPALRRASAGGRRDGAVRPQLVQPRRRGARDGLLHRG